MTVRILLIAVAVVLAALLWHACRLHALLRGHRRRLEDAGRLLHRHRETLLNSDKMASLGQMAGGVVHELNTPVGAVACMHSSQKQAHGPPAARSQPQHQSMLDFLCHRIFSVATPISAQIMDTIQNRIVIIVSTTSRSRCSSSARFFSRNS